MGPGPPFVKGRHSTGTGAPRRVHFRKPMAQLSTLLHPRARAVRGCAAVALILWVARATPGAAQEDYGPGNVAWNGLSDLMGLALEAGTPLRAPTRLDLSELSPQDGILVVHPTTPPPRAGLGSFLRAGGRVAVADDFGHGEALYAPYGIARHRPAPGGGPAIRGNPNLPVAQPHAELRHPLTSGVRALVTNHPVALRHAELEPLLTFGDGEGLVLVGAVGRGRLVTIADPSALINNMLQFRGNRAFASNLLSYLDGGRGGQLWLVSGDTPMTGAFRDPMDPLARARGWLSELATVDMPPIAVTLGSLLLMALFVLVATSSLPRQSPYASPTMFPPADTPGGFTGRVAFFRDRPRHLLHPLMVYKHELEGELVRHLGLHGRPELREVLGRLQRRGMNDEDLADLGNLLAELDRLRDRMDRPPGAPRISERKFRSMVAKGERILGRMEREKE